MSKLSLESLGELVAEKRGELGIRATAAKIGISPATLSRVENGQLPDLRNFRKLCLWLEIDSAKLLGSDTDTGRPPVAAVHFRKQQTMSFETASALAEMILAAQRALITRDKLL